MRIFVASTGRCGTKFMQNVFTELTGIDAKHEYMPHCIGKIMEDLNNNDIYSDETERATLIQVRRL